MLTPPPELIATLLDSAPFRSNQIHERDRWLIEHAYNAGLTHYMADHPITPPPELVSQWFLGARAMPVDQWVTDVATHAARWGADQELEACCILMDEWGLDGKDLMECRRPKPPSLKERALKALETEENDLSVTAASVIRRALEALDD